MARRTSFARLTNNRGMWSAVFAKGQRRHELACKSGRRVLGDIGYLMVAFFMKASTLACRSSTA